MDTTTFFPNTFFITNRKRLRELVGMDGPIAIAANGIMQRNADNVFTFRQDSNFWYLTGIDKPDIILVMDDNEDYLIVPTRDPVLETFEGKLDTDEFSRVSGVENTYETEEGWERFAKTLKKAKRLATLTPPPAYLDFFQFYTNPARSALVGKVKSYNGNLDIVDVRDELASMRVVKQAPELAAIRKAVDVTVAGVQYITDHARFSGYAHEYEAEADLTRQFRLAGYGHSFDPIVANGNHTIQMHATDNNGPMSASAMTILDVGAEVSNYAADIARTVMAGEPTKRQQALYDAVCEAQDYAFSLIKPGVIHKEYEQESARFIGAKLQELGVIKDAKDMEAVRTHFPHMTSHFVGLEPHDVGDYGRAMQVGSVMVVEPGMYIFDEGLGCRLEDVVVVTEDGFEHLSKDLARKLVV